MKTQTTRYAIIWMMLTGLLFCSRMQAQYITIPDANFVTFLQTNYPTCISGNRLDTTCAAVLGTTFLNLNNAHISDATGIGYFKNLTNLDVSNNTLVSLPALPAGLTDFHCGQNMLTSLPALPDGIQFFNCVNNSLTSLPALPSALQQLSASANNLTSLPTLPGGLTYLIVSRNQLTALPALPSLISYFDCGHNLLTSLPTLPAADVQLIADYNALTSLPSLPAALTYVSCTFNQLTMLPALPAGLLSLYCGNNVLDSLPALNPALQNLFCYSDHLSFLPPLNYGLQQLNCQQNNISYIASFPTTLTTIQVDDNPISSLPDLPPVLTTLSCTGDTNLHCLPRLTSIQQLSFIGCPITCVPNYIDSTLPNQSTPVVSTLPLCGDFNPNSCPVFWNITGRAYFDSDHNCTFGGTDVGERNIKVQLLDSGVLKQQVFTIGGGLYDFLTGNGIFSVTVDTSVLPFYVSCAPGNTRIDTISGADTLSYNNDFAFTCKPGFDIAAWSIYSRHFVPGHVVPVSFLAGDVSQFYGARCASGIGGSVVLQITGPAHYFAPDSTALTPSYVSADSIVWTVADYGLVNFYSDFAVLLQTDTSADLGQTVCLTVTANPVTGDNNPSNNTITNCYTVVSSYDPNEKLVSPVGDITPGRQWLTYTIQFQNTGNAPAGNIVVVDTLSNRLDASTFQLLAYSAQPSVKIDRGIIFFTFSGINLPDSGSNLAGSTGYVQYKIMPESNLASGTNINNTAYIYFDYNAPVATNTATNTVVGPASIPAISGNSNIDVKALPNPFSDITHIVVTGINEKFGFELYDITGRLQQNIPSVDNTQFDVRKGTLSKGVYLYRIIVTGKPAAYGKLVIE